MLAPDNMPDADAEWPEKPRGRDRGHLLVAGLAALAVSCLLLSWVLLAPGGGGGSGLRCAELLGQVDPDAGESELKATAAHCIGEIPCADLLTMPGWKSEYDSAEVAPELQRCLSDQLAAAASAAAAGQDSHQAPSVIIFLGTWCPDSRVAVPGVLKALDYAAAAAASGGGTNGSAEAVTATCVAVGPDHRCGCKWDQLLDGRQVPH